MRAALNREIMPASQSSWMKINGNITNREKSLKEINNKLESARNKKRRNFNGSRSINVHRETPLFHGTVPLLFSRIPTITRRGHHYYLCTSIFIPYYKLLRRWKTGLSLLFLSVWKGLWFLWIHKYTSSPFHCLFFQSFIPKRTLPPFSFPAFF